MLTDGYFDHVAEAGERWDLVAYKYYGDGMRIEPLLRANPILVGDPGEAVPLVFERGTLGPVNAIA